MMNSFYFTIENKIINRLFEIYIFNTFYCFEEYKQLRRLNLCKSILKNPRLIFANDATNLILATCPSDDWKIKLNHEFNNYKLKAPIELKQLLRLKFFSYKQLEKSNIYKSFHSDMIRQTEQIKKLLNIIYVEIHTKEW